MKYYFISYYWDKNFGSIVLDQHPLDFQIHEQSVGNKLTVISYQEITKEEYLKYSDLICN